MIERLWVIRLLPPPPHHGVALSDVWHQRCCSQTDTFYPPPIHIIFHVPVIKTTLMINRTCFPWPAVWARFFHIINRLKPKFLVKMLRFVHTNATANWPNVIQFALCTYMHTAYRCIHNGIFIESFPLAYRITRMTMQYSRTVAEQRWHAKPMCATESEYVCVKRRKGVDLLI